MVRNNRTTKNAGFTILELLVVFAIIAMLASVAMVYMGDARKRARVSRTEADLRSAVSAVELLATDTGLLPGGYDANTCIQAGNGNEVFLNTENAGLRGTGAGFPNWKGPYLEKEPVDPWGHLYWYDLDYDCSQGAPKGCEGQPQYVQAAVSSGPNGSDIGVYDSDNIVRVRCK